MSTMTATKTQTETTQSVQFRLPDATRAAEVTLDQALDYCAQKLALAGREDATELLRSGDPRANQYCRYSIAKQIAESLGALDQKVKAVYTLDYDATADDLALGEARPSSLVHLIVWAERQTSALEALVQSLDQALVRRMAEATGAAGLAHVLDVQVVDDAQVQARSGYGALLASIHNRPLQIWER